MNKSQQKKKIESALLNNPQIDSCLENAKKVFKSHIGFEEEKEKFKDYIELYLATKGDFCPKKEIICYSSPPGMGKTTFIQMLNKAMGRSLEIISCAGVKEFKEFSILGNDKDKPSLVSWVIEKNGYKNPIILFDEIEKIKGEKIQQDLISLFELYKDEKNNRPLFDKYYEINIELSHITFFATVNYPQYLVSLWKNIVKMKVLKKYSKEDKKSILELKKNEIEFNIEKIYGEKKEIISKKNFSILLEILLEIIKESGVRQTERVFRKIEKEYIVSKENNQIFSLGDLKKWTNKNVLNYQERFQFELKHKIFLFPLWITIWILLLAIIVNKIILKRDIEEIK